MRLEQFEIIFGDSSSYSCSCLFGELFDLLRSSFLCLGFPLFILERCWVASYSVQDVQFYPGDSPLCTIAFFDIDVGKEVLDVDGNAVLFAVL